MKPIVLASSSPRRKELLENIGFKFIVDPVDIEEDLSANLNPTDLAKRLSLEKARVASERHPDAIVIAADTFGVLEGKLLGKPTSAEQACSMLRLLSGRCHLVITGFTIMDAGAGKTVTRAVRTAVYFRKLSRAEILTYVATGEPLDKAAAYAIQGLGALLVDKIEGDYYNVIGLPLSALARELKKFGVRMPG